MYVLIWKVKDDYLWDDSLYYNKNKTNTSYMYAKHNHIFKSLQISNMNTTAYDQVIIMLHVRT